MAKSFDDLARRTMSKHDRQRAHERASDIIAKLFLRQIREAVGISQKDLAEMIGVKQPGISKLEKQADMQIATLRRIIEALGGELDITARFPRGTVKIQQFESCSVGHVLPEQQHEHVQLV